jgi:Zn-dependent protease/CBS domain-containing protein
MPAAVRSRSVADMPGRSWRVARIAGIPIGVSPWWLLIVALITWVLGSSYFPEQVHGIAPLSSYALGLASVLLLFASLLLHELGHAIVARRRGVRVQEIDLWLLGGVSRMAGEAHDPGDELRYALAGPAVSALVTACFGAIDLLLPASTSATLRALVDYQVLINALILGFNLIPAFPLDGGRVLRSILWRRGGDMRQATTTAARVGRAFGYLLIALGFLELVSGAAVGGMWLALIGFFIVIAAGAQATGAEIQAVLSGVSAAKLMASPVIAIPAELPVEIAGVEYFGRYPYTAFPVVDERGRALGLLTIDRVQALSAAQRGRTLVASVADRDPALRVGEAEDVAALLQRPAFARVGRAVVVDAHGLPVGLVSITDVKRAIRSARLLDGRPPTRVAG